MQIKFSDEQLAKFGFKTQEELIAKLEKVNEPLPPAPSPAAPPAPAALATPETIVARLATIEANLQTFIASRAAKDTELLAAVGTEAKKVASQEVSAAIAKAGGAALGQKSDPADPAPGKAAVDPNDFGAQFDASKELQAEFTSKASFVKYMEAQSKGRIRTHAKTPELNRN